MADNKKRFTSDPYSSVVEDNGFAYWGRSRQLAVDISSAGIASWKPATSSENLPIESNVKDKVPYGINQVGTYGAINEENGDIAIQIRNNILQLMEDYLPDDWEKMKYLVNPEDNDFYSNAKQYGILIEDDFHTNNNLCKETVQVAFRMIMTNDFIPQDDDLDARNAVDELIQEMELIRRRITKGKFAVRTSQVTDWDREVPEYINDNKIVILEATFSLEYTVNN